MAGIDYIVFKENEDGSWTQVGLTTAATKDAAIAAVRTSAGTFVAVTAQTFTPRTFAVPPRAPATPKPPTAPEVQ